MSVWLVLIMLLALCGGYVAGRTRPIDALEQQAHFRTFGWTPTKHYTAWGLTWVALNPKKAWHAYRHRNDPKPEPARITFGTSGNAPSKGKA